MDMTSKKKFVSRDIFNKVQSHLKQKLLAAPLHDDTSIAGWFMGTKGENREIVKKLLSTVVERTLDGRKELFPEDPGYITENVKKSEPYLQAIQDVERKSDGLLDILTEYSVPFSSLRYQGHMTWDITLPSIIGYISGMLQNQNNVTPQASPATTLLEIIAANDISQMAGFKVRPLDDENEYEEPRSWSHITCDGTVANIESVWAARELKYMPLGIKYSLEDGQEYASIRDRLTLPNGQPFYQASAWQLLNMKQDDALMLPAKMAELLKDQNTDEAEVWKTLGDAYSLNAKGMSFFQQKYLAAENIKAPAIIVPSTKHYSWVKSASLLGMGGGQKGLTEQQLIDINVIGEDAVLNVYVDAEGRVKTDLLQSVLNTCKQHKKPILMNVAVVGSTEEGAVDPVEKLLAIREDFRRQSEPFEYSVHTDAAWGGYFLACIRKPFDMGDKPQTGIPGGLFDNSLSWFRSSVFESMSQIHQCDSVTIDPHKMGYIPYPAGSLTYRNEKIINLLSFSAPYISSETDDGGINTRNIGESGIEGSKPGAAATAVYLSHQTIRPDQRGYGHIINQSMLNSKLFYLYLATLDLAFPDDLFDLALLTPLTKEQDSQRKAIAEVLWNRQVTKLDLLNHREVTSFLRNISGDQNIVDYVFVDKNDRSPERTLTLNNDLFERLSVLPGHKVSPDQVFVSMTTFNRDDYGDDFMNALADRLYENGEKVDAIPCIRSVILDPWAIYTHEYDQMGMFNFFTDIFLPKLRKEVNQLCTPK
ncbi:glutamate decarboxylase [Hahella sp. CCB-MM4]|uniref:pyridoxal phosphate-dependent decarboxylase family protein n=1 Tax=Hahella sp. (strain CCB-MM4) TaxID=1926491 RepID=UPI000B9A2B1F|nr:pyridoxal-dependent decarboxylase [Hahella sp. CCB-MM4]OZG74213.1 glutamate decarboxylase [Hahella sp. CCB-MM4]